MVVVSKSAANVDSDPSVIGEIRSSQDSLEKLGKELEESMNKLHELQDRFENSVKKHEKTLKSLHTTLKNAKQSQASCSASHQPVQPSSSSPIPAVGDDSIAGRHDSAPKKVSDVLKDNNPRTGNDSLSTERPYEDLAVGKHSAHNDSIAAQAEELKDIERRLGELQKLMPASGGMFVEVFLGTLNVRFTRKSERLAFKAEYERLKMKLAPCFLILSILCLIYEEYRWVHMILQLALSGYYVSLAIRENILRVNGSNIKAWWIIHHYFTTMQATLLLTWPNGSTYIQYRKALHIFGLYNSVLQIFQTRYQMARLYTLRSLGRAGEMDVASSDSTQIHWTEGMVLLLPLILLGQVMQAVQAFFLMKIYRSSPGELQILLLSLLFFANFVGNFYTTMVVLHEKRTGRYRNRPSRATQSWQHEKRNYEDHEIEEKKNT